MNYGSSSYGSTPIGGSIPADWQIFLPWQQYSSGDYEAEAEVVSDESFYEVVILQNTGFEDALEYRIYSRNDPGETPQLQATGGGGLFAQSIIGMARFILVEMSLSLSGVQVNIKGRPYTQ